MEQTKNEISKRTEPDAGEAEHHLYSIGDFAAEFGVSARAIRFYETKGLLAPRRVGANRVYDHRDHARLTIILRAKRLGFSLEEVSQYLDLYDADPDQAAQIRHLLDKVERTIAGLEQKQNDIRRTLAELQEIRNQCVEGLSGRDAPGQPAD